MVLSLGITVLTFKLLGFFMISYFFVNMACFAASYTKSPGWRPCELEPNVAWRRRLCLARLEYAIAVPLLLVLVS